MKLRQLLASIGTCDSNSFDSITEEWRFPSDKLDSDVDSLILAAEAMERRQAMAEQAARLAEEAEKKP
jgi:hypothetical protein